MNQEVPWDEELLAASEATTLRASKSRPAITDRPDSSAALLGALISVGVFSVVWIGSEISGIATTPLWAVAMALGVLVGAKLGGGRYSGDVQIGTALATYFAGLAFCLIAITYLRNEILRSNLSWHLMEQHLLDDHFHNTDALVAYAVGATIVLAGSFWVFKPRP